MQIINKPYPKAPLDETDEQFLNYMNGFRAGEIHSKPSPDTLKFMNKMTDKLNALEIATAKIDGKMDYLSDTVKQHIEDEKVFRDKQDEYKKDQDKKQEEYRKEQSLIISKLMDTKANKEDLDKKADKWVGNIWVWAGAIVGAALLNALINSLIK